MQHCLCGLNQGLQADASDRQANVLLDLRKQAVSKKNISRVLNLGQYHNINPAAGGFHHFNHVTVEELCLQAVGTKGSNFAVEVERVERFHQRFTGGNFLGRSAAVFQIEDHLIGIAGGGLGHHLERVSRTSQLTAPYGDVSIGL